MPRIIRCCAVALAAKIGVIAPVKACGQTPGVVWQGTDRLSLSEIAGLLAPMLWFSADEPLLAEGRPPIPTAHPCDKPTTLSSITRSPA